MNAESAYTTEFLDGPGKCTVGPNAIIETSGTDKGKAGMDKKRLDYYKK